MLPRILALMFLTTSIGGCLSGDEEGDGADDGGTVPPPSGPSIAWLAPVDLEANGYEPSIAADSAGNMFMTAHKELNRPDTWPYGASWFWVSTDAGATWGDPSALNPTWKAFVGDEGDIAVDGRDWVYFLDTYLADNHIHVWSDGGATWQYSEPAQRTTLIDDRPWIAAQGDGIVHYLGNNGVQVAGGRFWYYRSTDGGLTFSPGTPVPGNGWSHVDAERAGDHAYIVTEGGGLNAAGPIVIYVGADQGASFDFGAPITVGEREGSGRDYPTVSVAPDGAVWVEWVDCGGADNCNDNGGEDPARIFVARSTDHGATWESWDVTPFEGFFDYVTLCAGPEGRVGVSFYAASTPVGPDSEWLLYGGMALDALEGRPVFGFSQADAEATYTGEDLHALHDFMECAITPDGALNLAYQQTTGAMSEDGPRYVWFVRGTAS